MILIKNEGENVASIRVRLDFSPILWPGDKSPWISLLDPSLITLLKESDREIDNFTISNNSHLNLEIRVSINDYDDVRFHSIPPKGSMDIRDDVKEIHGRMAKKNSMKSVVAINHRERKTMISIVDLNIKSKNNYG